MQAIAAIGLDIAKSDFQVHRANAAGEVSVLSVKASLCSDVLSEVWRHVWLASRLVPHPTTSRVRSKRLSYRAVDAAGLREALTMVFGTRSGSGALTRSGLGAV